MINYHSTSGLRGLENFWNNVERGEPDACWPWKFSTCKGYPVCRVLKDGVYIRRAHRAAYWLTYGPITGGLFVCHRCDNPICCNPNHLFLGTHVDNMHDAKTKNRMHGVRGEAHYAVKLSQDDLAEIRRLSGSGATQMEIAQAFSVNPSTISRILGNKRRRNG